MKTNQTDDGRRPDDAETRGEFPQLFTDKEYRRLLLAAMGKNGATEGQMKKFVDMCERMKMDAFLLELILKDRVVVTDYDDQDEPFFART